jgi:hypothetical protein
MEIKDNSNLINKILIKDIAGYAGAVFTGALIGLTLCKLL